MSQLSVGDDSLGSWSNLSFEDEHPDDNSSFLHLSDRYTTVIYPPIFLSVAPSMLHSAAISFI